MAAKYPVKIYGSGDGLQRLSGAEIDAIADRILYDFATNTTGVGSLTIRNPADGSGNAGVFSDTVRDEAVGTHPASGSITTNQQSYDQNLTKDNTSSGSTSPCFANASHIQTMGGTGDSTTENISTILAACTSKLAASTSCVGSYYLVNSTSSLPGGSGTGWASIGTMTDTIRATSGSGTDTTTYTTYIKQGSDPGSVSARPVKVSSGTAVQAMTDSEISAMSKYFRNYISTTGIGTYKMATSAPGVGTQVAVGSIVDTKRDVSIGVSYDRGVYSSGFDRGNFSSGYDRGNFSSGYDRGAFSSGYSRGTFSSGYSRGSFQGAPGHFYSRGTFSSGYARGTFSSGYDRGAFSTGFDRGNFSSGYDRGNFSTGFDRGSFSGDTIAASSSSITYTLWKRTA
jgi:hypothetical protein